ncbi:MAG: hypothetical protein ACFFG0_02565 [Candidatus Thorarchaeota archaeon]
MMAYKIDQKDIDRLFKELRGFGKILASPNLQLFRANKFREYVIEHVKGNKLNLKPLKESTKIISGDHDPLWKTGGMLENMAVRPVGKNAADVGYFEDDSSKVPNTNITYTKLAILQHTGFRIKTTGEKGQKVLRWLAAQGIFDANPDGQSLKKAEGWIVVEPRPFLNKAFNLYIHEDRDIKVVDEFINKAIKAPTEVI